MSIFGADMSVTLITVATPEDWGEARLLVEAYASALNIDLSYQAFEHEVDNLPAHYGPPDGVFLLGQRQGIPVACGGIRALPDLPGTAELKRLYVIPDARHGGVGRRIAEALIETASGLGYTRLVLDTLPSMVSARALYRSLGFRSIPPYRFSPVYGTDFLELHLPGRSTPPHRPR